MKDARWWLALLTALLGLSVAWGQFQIGVSTTRSSGIVGGRSSVITYAPPTPVYSFSLGSYYGLPACPPPFFTPVVPRPPHITVFYAPPPILVLPPMRPAAPEPDLAIPPIPPLPALPGQRPGAPEPAKPAAKPQAKEKVPPREPPLPAPPLPELDPRTENARQAALGREAFAFREYGRAEHRFRQASIVLPTDPQAHFLLAQARFALGKYHEAVAAIHKGLKLQPDWPRSRYRPLELYGDHVADLAEHMLLLEQALAAHPDEPDLLFLAGYFLWFDGRQDEAILLFERAAARGVPRQWLEGFFQARPQKPVDFL